MTLEEQRLAEMLHRLTPDPPRPITVEDIATRTQRASMRQRVPMRQRVLRRERSRWVPALAAASVLAVVGTSAGVSAALTSHQGKPAAPGNSARPTGTPTASVQPLPLNSAGTRTSRPVEPPVPIAGGPWSAQMIHRDTLSPDTLVGSGNLLYVFSDEALLRIDPSNGNVLDQASIQGAERPVVAGNMVWVAEPTGDGMVLLGYDALTLAPVRTVTVPGVSSQRGVLAAGPGGHLYAAAGSTVAVVDPSSGSVSSRIPVTGGQAVSVAVSPDGGTLYVGAYANGSFSLVSYDPATGAQRHMSAMADGGEGGYLVATTGGVWGTTGTGMTQRTWFAPGGDLLNLRYVSAGASGGLDSVPTYAGGVVWIGGTRSLQCLNPASGTVLATTPIPAYGGIPRHVGSIAYAGGRAFATFQDQRIQMAGLAKVTPPAACTV